MSTKEKVINILDILPEDLIKSLYDYAQFLAYQQEDILTEEKLAELDRIKQEMDDGEYITHEELLRELKL